MLEFVKKYESLEIGNYIWYSKDVNVVKENSNFYVIHCGSRTLGFDNLVLIYQILNLFGYED